MPLQVPLSEEPQSENTTASEEKERCRLPGAEVAGALSMPSLNAKTGGAAEALTAALLLVFLPWGSCAPQLSGQQSHGIRDGEPTWGAAW